MKKRTRNLLIGTGIAAAGAAAAGAAAYKLTNTLVKVAMDRETPEMAQTREKVRGAAPSPFDRETEEMARQLEQQDTQRVEILSYDGEKLAAQRPSPADHCGHARLALLLGQGFWRHCPLLAGGGVQRSLCRTAGPERERRGLYGLRHDRAV